MRKVIVSEFVTLDGIMESPEKWSFPFWSEEIGRFKHDELFSSDALLLGRVTYELFAQAWPNMKDEDTWKMARDAGAKIAEKPPEGESFSVKMNSIKKYVVSKTLKEAGWQNSQIINGELVEEINKLKHRRGKMILVNGSAKLANSLSKHGLVDEYRLLVYPVVVGSGKRLFESGIDKSLKLVKTKKFATGVVLLVYRPEKT